MRGLSSRRTTRCTTTFSMRRRAHRPLRGHVRHSALKCLFCHCAHIRSYACALGRHHRGAEELAAWKKSNQLGRLFGQRDFVAQTGDSEHVNNCAELSPTRPTRRPRRDMTVQAPAVLYTQSMSRDEADANRSRCSDQTGLIPVHLYVSQPIVVGHIIPGLTPLGWTPHVG